MKINPWPKDVLMVIRGGRGFRQAMQRHLETIESIWVNKEEGGERGIL